MIQSNNVEIHSIGLHKVGNKYMDEPLELSTELINLDDYAGMILPTISGKTVGKEIGNICINKTIPLKS